MKIMAVDYGDAHTGLACCDRTQTLASPIGVIDERNFQTCVEKVAAAAVEYEVGEVGVGNPISMNGTLSHCPIFSAIVFSKSTWSSFRNSMKKRKTNISVRQRPKKKPR